MLYRYIVIRAYFGVKWPARVGGVVAAGTRQFRAGSLAMYWVRLRNRRADPRRCSCPSWPLIASVGLLEGSGPVQLGGPAARHGEWSRQAGVQDVVD